MKTMQCQEYRELVAAHVDGVLVQHEAQEAQAHIDGCAECARVFAWEQRASVALKAKLRIAQAPAGMKLRLAERLQRKQGLTAYLESWFLNPRWVGSFAVLAVVLVSMFLLRDQGRDDFLRDAVSRYQSVVATRPGASLTGGFQAPAARRLDLTPLGYRLTDNAVTRTAGQERRESVFARDEKEWVLAQEVDGVKSLPNGKGEIVRTNNREFVKFTKAGINLVAWRDNDLLCVLTSAMPSDQLLGIAHKIAGRG